MTVLDLVTANKLQTPEKKLGLIHHPTGHGWESLFQIQIDQVDNFHISSGVSYRTFHDLKLAADTMGTGDTIGSRPGEPVTLTGRTGHVKGNAVG